MVGEYAPRQHHILLSPKYKFQLLVTFENAQNLNNQKLKFVRQSQPLMTLIGNEDNQHFFPQFSTIFCALPKTIFGNIYFIICNCFLFEQVLILSFGKLSKAFPGKNRFNKVSLVSFFSQHYINRG